MADEKPYYPTREELKAGVAPPPAVPPSRMLRLMGNFSNLDRWAVRWTGFSFISWQAARDRGIPYQHSLLLTSIGRKTGLKRSAVLPYVPDDQGGLIVVASNGGRPNNPAWLENIRTNPQCEIVVNRRKRSASGSIPSGKERERLLDMVAVTRPQVYNYEYHAAQHGRLLEIVVLK